MVIEILKTHQLNKAVNDQNQILVGKFDNVSWIRCNGKGSFSNSPRMKQWAESHIESGGSCIVVDLEGCTGMDSTFMGTMAGIAMKLAKLPNGALQVIGANHRNKSALEDLGLCMLLDMDPQDAAWQPNISDIRESLKASSEPSDEDDFKHVLDAHKLLCEADENNDEKFSTVLDVLEAELKNRSDKN